MKHFIKIYIWLLTLLTVILICYGGYIYIAMLKAESDFYEPIDKEKQDIINKYVNKNHQNYNTNNTNIVNKLDNENNLTNQQVNNKNNKENNKEISVNFLLLGVDSRHGGGGRSDTIIIGKYNIKENKILLFSIPRDTYVEVPGHGFTKINHSYAYGKTALTIITLEQFLNIKFDKYISIDFKGFREIVDSIGGVPVNVEKDMYWKDNSDGKNTIINLKKEYQVLNGIDALGYARFRHDAEGDFGRMKRQQRLIKIVISQMLSPDIIFKLPKYIEVAGSNLKTDFSLNELEDMSTHLLNNKNIKFETDVLNGKGIMENGVYYFKISTEEINRFKEKYQKF